MTQFVKKANNKDKAVPQRDAFNMALDSVIRDDGSFDLDMLLNENPDAFKLLLHLIDYQITGNAYYISPTEVYVLPAKKYEGLFEDLEWPAFEAINRAVASEEHCPGLMYFRVRQYFLRRAVITDLPDRLKCKVATAAKEAHGEDFDTTALESGTTKLYDILEGGGVHSFVFFDIETFEFQK